MLTYQKHILYKERKKDMKKLNDFGEKIGGAKKDIWAMLHAMTEEEKNSMARRDKLWKRPNYQALAKDGVPADVLFWRNEMRKSVTASVKENVTEYIEFCLRLHDDVEKCKEIEDIVNFYNSDILKYFSHYTEDANDKRWTYKDSMYKYFCDGNAILRYVYSTEKKIKKDFNKSDFLRTKDSKEEKKYETMTVKYADIESKPMDSRPGYFSNKISVTNGSVFFYTTTNFAEKAMEAEDKVLRVVCYDKKHLLAACTSDEDAAKVIAEDKAKKMQQKESAKKETFLPPHLSNIERTGSNYNFFRLHDGNVLLTRYGLRGGEFGNYTTAKDRLGSINMAYDAFEDLYTACGISPKDVSLGGKLAIAFGARGRGNALAHYEPLKNVINMTKKRGAGSLAHEWGHALDMYIGVHYNLHGFMSANASTGTVPKAAKELIDSLKYQSGKETQFYAASKQFDKDFKKSGNGYWASAPEMFARAFACYVKDKLGDDKSDYLVGHSECAKYGKVVAYPLNEERKVINANFDSFFAELVENGIFSRHEKMQKSTNDDNDDCQDDIADNIIMFTGTDGQILFC